MNHAISTLHYVATFVALVVLTLLTWWLSTLPLGAMEVPVALAIASLKMLLVVLFFMHLVEQPATNAFVLVFGVTMLVLLVALSGVDVATREDLPRPPAVGVGAPA